MTDEFQTAGELVCGYISYYTPIDSVPRIGKVDGTLAIAPYSPCIATIPAEPRTLAETNPYEVYPITSSFSCLAWNTPVGGKSVVIFLPGSGEIFAGGAPPWAYQIIGPCLGHVRDVLKLAKEAAK